MKKLSLAIIAKNNEGDIDKLLKSTAGFFDETIVVDTGSTDKTKEVAKRYGAKIYDFEWCDDFSKAREFSVEKCTNDWVMWLDTDDILQNGEKIKLLMDKIDDRTHAIAFPYYYSFDENGNCTSILKAKRIFKKNDFVWVNRCHEVLHELRGGNTVYNEEVKVVHNNKELHNKAKLNRNILLLTMQLKDEGKHPDARTVYYLANTYFGLERFEDALKLYQRYVDMSGWDEERYNAWIRIGVIERHLGRYDKSIAAINQAWNIYPHVPDAYLQNGITYQKLEQYDRSNWNLALAIKMPKPDFVTVYNPRDYTITPLKLMANNYIAKDKLDMAHGIYQQILEINQHDKEAINIFKELTEHTELQRKAQEYVSKFNKIRGDEVKIKELYATIPDELKSLPSIIRIRNSFDLKKQSSGKDIAIYCGESWEVWSPDSVKTGIGGSEEAVINLCEQLQLQGYNVTVYNSIRDAKEFNGVLYKPWWEFNPKDLWDYFISWRCVELFDNVINAKKRYLWLHDTINHYEITEHRLKNIDKFIVLSEFHRMFLPNVPQEKVFVTTNGVDTALFTGGVERKAHKMIYTSSYDRGLQYLLESWSKIKEKVPDAELHIYYGWGNFDKKYYDNQERKNWKKYMEFNMKQPGITEHGRVSHPEIAKAIESSSVFSYPCDFEEINCISAIKAQIGGAIPVTTDYAALEETVKYGVKVDCDLSTQEGKDKYINVLIDVLLKESTYSSQRNHMMKSMREFYDWNVVAKQWINKLFI